jgi:CRP-like cAMP-binding protein
MVICSPPFGQYSCLDFRHLGSYDTAQVRQPLRRKRRLARVLLLLANFGKEGKPETVIPKMSQETLAEIVGATRSRVSFFMNRFRKLGFIKYNGALEVHSSLLNVILHD